VPYRVQWTGKRDGPMKLCFNKLLPFCNRQPKVYQNRATAHRIASDGMWATLRTLHGRLRTQLVRRRAGKFEADLCIHSNEMDFLSQIEISKNELASDMILGPDSVASCSKGGRATQEAVSSFIEEMSRPPVRFASI